MTTPTGAVHRLLARWERDGAGDGLPIAPPTGEAVAAMLADGPPAGTRLPALPPGLQPMTVGDVAACAVMAGCRPGALPVLLAALAGLADPAFNLLGVSTTTGNAAVGMIVHGEAAARAGVSGGANCLGPTPAANAAIGRALAVCLRLLAGAVPGRLDMATLGQPAKYGLCLAESEAAMPDGWSPLFRDLGVTAPGAVTVFASSGILEVADASAYDAGDLLATLCAAVPLAAAMAPTPADSHHVVVLPPEWAAKLAAGGFTRARVGEHLHVNATLPVDLLPPPTRAAARQRGMDRVSWAASPADFLVVVAGDVGIKAAYLPGWPGGSRAVTVPVG